MKTLRVFSRDRFAGKGVTCQLDRLPELTKWFSDQTSTSLKKASDDLNVFLQAASNENVPVEDRRALLSVVRLVQELSNGKYELSKQEFYSLTCLRHTNFNNFVALHKAACIDFSR